MSTTSEAEANASNQYERLLLAAQHAQVAADASVAELAAIRRRLAEAPRVLQQRTDDLTRARTALEKAEEEIHQAREQMASKQAAAARLIETASEAQRALAHALVNQDAADPQAIEALSRQIEQETAPARPISLPASYDRSQSDAPRPWTPPPTAAAVNQEVVQYMVDRDALCPSCGTNLRGINSARCPSCRLQLSVPVLKSVAPLWFQASGMIWFIRVITIIALALTGLLTRYALVGRKPPGCGIGSECEFAFLSPWSTLMGIPVTLLALPVFAALLFATFRVNLARRDAVRKRAWMWISGLAFLAAGAGVWFILVQAFWLHAICPHCIAVNILSILLGVLVYFQAPINRPEKLPPRASGHVTIAKPAALRLGGATLLTVALFAGAHTLNNASRSEAMVIKEADPNADDPLAKNGGLMMGTVDFVPDGSKRRALEPVTPPTTPPTTPRPSPPPVTPPVTPREPAPTKTIKPDPMPTPSTPEPGGLLLPGLTPEPDSKSKSTPSDEPPPPGLLLPGVETKPQPPAKSSSDTNGKQSSKQNPSRDMKSIGLFATDGAQPAPGNAASKDDSQPETVTIDDVKQVPLQLLDDGLDSILGLKNRPFDEDLIDDSRPPLRED